MNIKPLADRVLVLPAPAEEETIGGIIIPEAVYSEWSVKADSVCKKAVDSSLDWIQVGSIQNQMAKTMSRQGTNLCLNRW